MGESRMQHSPNNLGSTAQGVGKNQPRAPAGFAPSNALLLWGRLSQAQSTAPECRTCWWLPALTPQHPAHTAVHYLPLTAGGDLGGPHENSKRKAMCCKLEGSFLLGMNT